MQAPSGSSSDFHRMLAAALCWQEKVGWPARHDDLLLAIRLEALWRRKKRRFSMTHVLYRYFMRHAASELEARHRTLLARLLLEAVLKAHEAGGTQGND